MLEKRKYGGTFRQIFSLAGLVQAMVPENSRSTERPSGGESGIRTHGTLRYTRFPSVRLKPLGHLSRSIKRNRGRRAAQPCLIDFTILRLRTAKIQSQGAVLVANKLSPLRASVA